MSRFLKPLAWALPVVMLLAGCNGTDNEAKQPEPPHTTYSKADWSALPEVTGADLQGGFTSWRSACTRLKADPNWGNLCSEAAKLPANPDVAQISSFLQTHLDVYSLRSAEGSSDGLITGYYEPVRRGPRSGLRGASGFDCGQSGQPLPRTQGQAFTRTP